MSHEPQFDLFPAHRGAKSPYAVALAALTGALLTTCFSIGLIYWTSPILALGVIAMVSTYLFRLAWERTIKFQNVFLKGAFSAAMLGIVSFGFLIVYLLER